MSIKLLPYPEKGWEVYEPRSGYVVSDGHATKASATECAKLHRKVSGGAKFAIRKSA